MKYRVEAREVHVAVFYVDARDEAEAIQKVAEGEGDYTSSEYSHTLGTEDWTAEQVDDD